MTEIKNFPPFITMPINHSLEKQVKTMQLEAAHLIPDEDVFIIAHQMQIDTPRHSHDYYECVLVSKGVVLNQVDDTELYLLPNSLFFMNLNSYHALRVVDPDAIVINLGLRPDLFGSGIFHKFLKDSNPVADFLRGNGTHPYIYYPFPKSTRLRSIIDSILQAYAKADFHDSFEVTADVLLLLNELRTERSYSYTGLDKRSYNMLTYIQSHYRTITLQRLAEHFSFNPNYLSRYIKQHFGITTSALMTEVRLQQATQQLMITSRSIDEIATDVGYQSTSHFYRVFKSNMQTTPLAYRAMHQKLNEFRLNSDMSNPPN